MHSIRQVGNIYEFQVVVAQRVKLKLIVVGNAAVRCFWQNDIK